MGCCAPSTPTAISISNTSLETQPSPGSHHVWSNPSQTPVKPQSTSFHPECLAYGAWAALLKITEQENQRSGLAVVMRPSGESTHRIPVKCAKRELGRGSPTATTHITVALTLFPCQACQVGAVAHELTFHHMISQSAAQVDLHPVGVGEGKGEKRFKRAKKDDKVEQELTPA